MEQHHVGGDFAPPAPGDEGKPGRAPLAGDPRIAGAEDEFGPSSGSGTETIASRARK